MTKVIYDNYSLYDMFDDEKQFLMDEYPELCTVEVENANGNISYEPSDETVWDQIYLDDEFYWDNTYKCLKNHFANKKLIMFGSVGRWDKSCSGFDVGTFEVLFNDIISDCDYVKIIDDDGHLFLECSHHDGTNYVQFKELTDKGYEVFDNWECSYGKFADYSVSRIGQLLTNMNFYSKLPHLWRTVFA